MTIESLALTSFSLAVVAYVYSMVLTEPEMILNPWYNFLDKHLSRWPWLFKPLIGCFRCVAGQMAFLHFLFRYLKAGSFEDYNAGFHIFTICFTILLSQLIHKTYTWTKTI